MVVKERKVRVRVEIINKEFVPTSGGMPLVLPSGHCHYCHSEFGIALGYAGVCPVCRCDRGAVVDAEDAAADAEEELLLANNKIKELEVEIEELKKANATQDV